MPALVTLDKNSLEVIETTRLLHGSTLTSHLRAMYDAAVNVADLRKCKLVIELADPELTAVYALKIKNEKRECHNSIVTLTAPE